MGSSAICSIDHCGKPVRGRGYCNSHYQSFWKHGDPLKSVSRSAIPRSSDGFCTIDGCQKPIHSTLHCSMHAERIRLHGTPFTAGRKVRGTCTVEGCEKRHYGRGLCIAHYKREVRNGDPLGGQVEHGGVRRWLETVAIPFVGAGCLPFPFARNNRGYGHINAGDRYMGAHVFVLERAIGDKPSPKHECCHTCGNGHLACVNPGHLYWGTRAQNIEDAFRHGTRQRAASRL